MTKTVTRSPKTKKPTKTKRLPPKRNILRAPRSSWIAFLSSIRSEKREEYSSLSFGELCQQLSPVWSSMSTEQKQPFIDQYTRDKDRYERQLKDLSEEDIKILRAHKRLRKKMRAGRPKAAMSSYMIYVAEERARVVIDHPDIDFQSIGQELGRRWRILSDDQKCIYVRDALLDRARFDADLVEWKKKKAEEKAACKKEHDSKKTPASSTI